jgi:hypothetical protein
MAVFALGEVSVILKVLKAKSWRAWSVLEFVSSFLVVFVCVFVVGVETMFVYVAAAALVVHVQMGGMVVLVTVIVLVLEIFQMLLFGVLAFEVVEPIHFVQVDLKFVALILCVTEILFLQVVAMLSVFVILVGFVIVNVNVVGVVLLGGFVYYFVVVEVNEVGSVFSVDCVVILIYISFELDFVI